MPISISVIAVFLLADPAYETGREFLKAGFYDDAITEFQRYLFFNPDGDSAMSAYVQLGRAYFELGRTGEAVEMTALSGRHAAGGRERAECELRTAVVAIAAGQYSRAEMILLQLEVDEAGPPVRERAALLRAVACVYSYKWPDARAACDEYFQYRPDPERQKSVDSLLRSAESMKLRSPETALWLSTFLPGAGQVYSGAWREGLNALALNGGFAAWVGYKLMNRYWSDACVIASFLWQRYYIGNRYHARRLAEEKNDQARRRAGQRIIDRLRSRED